MNPTLLPVARELFAQWQRARGNREEQAATPFSRRWETLLEDARLVSATDRSEAEQDARSLAADGWLQCKTMRYKSHLIERVVIPLASEARWCEAFGFVAPDREEARKIQDFQWIQPLSFVREGRLNIAFDELQKLNDFIPTLSASAELVPIKERSLQIFGDEKRLDALLSSSLFRPDRLSLERDLRCELIGVPLGWRRGPKGSESRPLLIIENAATWHSYCRWNSACGYFSGVVYGDGNRFVDGVRYMPDIFTELGGMRPVQYFGDLDPQGLRIPQEASARLQAAGLPRVEPHLWSYQHLLRMGTGKETESVEETAPPSICDWLGDCAEEAYHLFSRGKRLAQEYVGWDFLKGQVLDYHLRSTKPGKRSIQEEGSPTGRLPSTFC